MKALIDAALSRSRTVLSVLAMILLAGSVAYSDIPKESDPDINIPILYVSVTLDGVSPIDAERLLIRPLETELSTIEGVKEMRSTAYLGGANVVLEFDAGFDVDRALDDAREAVDKVRPDLPDEADEPTVNEVNFSLFPVIVVTLSGEVPERALLRLARALQDRIETIPTVLEARLSGDRDEMVEVEVDPLILESYGLDPGDLIQLIDRNNKLVAAGAQDTGAGRFTVQVPGLFETARDVMEMPVKVSGDGVVRFRDIATVKRTFKDPEGFARIDGKPAIGLEVSKRTGENIIETIEAVKAAVAESRGFWPDAVDVTFSQDKSSDIRLMLSDLQNNVISAVLLVMIVIVGALGLRSAGLVGMAVPGSFLTGILVLHAIGFTVNIVVLFSLILAVGMLVDGAIVVTEFADRKLRDGFSAKSAYAMAAKRMAWPITASTATTLAAFAPLVFWPGVVGEFMKFLPITLLATLAASLAMALLFLPTLGATISAHKRSEPPKGVSENEDAVALSALGGFTARYVRMLRAALSRPGLILFGAGACLILAQVAYGAFGKGVEFFPEVEPRNAALNIHARGNMSIWERDRLIRQVEERVLLLQAERGEFKSIYAVSRTRRQNEEAEDVIGVVRLEFGEWDERRPADEILADIRERTADLAGIFVEPRKEEGGPPTGKPVQIEVSSLFPELIEPEVVKIRALLETIPKLRDIEDSRPIPGIEWRISVDRAQAAKFGVDVVTIGNAVKLVTNGIVVTGYRPDDADKEIDIIVRFPERYRTIEMLDRIRVPTNAGSVPLTNFVTRSAQRKVSELQRTDGRRVMSVKADIVEGVLADDMVGIIAARLPELRIDPRVGIEFKGENKEQKDAADFLSKAFAVALFAMAVILVTQFNSFYSAFLILSAVIMSTVGVMLGLLITGQPFGIVMSGIGVIALAGIVVNNNIVLIDTFDRIRATEPDPMTAILKTGAQRLRPVLLTTVTTILGLMPMVLSTNIDFVARSVSIGAPSTQWWSQLASAIVFGLAFATVLTLVVTPSALMLRENVLSWRAGGGRLRWTRPAPRPAE